VKQIIEYRFKFKRKDKMGGLRKKIFTFSNKTRFESVSCMQRSKITLLFEPPEALF